MLKPAGVCKLTVVVPALTAWNVAVAAFEFTLNATGLEIVATAGLELLSVRFTGLAPGRKPWAVPVGASVPGCKTAVPSVTVVSPVAPLLMFPLVMTNPEGMSVTVAEPSLRPVPLALIVTVPLPARA